MPEAVSNWARSIDSPHTKLASMQQIDKQSFLIAMHAKNGGVVADERKASETINIDEQNTFDLVYLDDVLIFSKSLEEHLHHLDTMLSLLA